MTADAIVARSPFGEIEARIGLMPIEELLAERDTLVKEIAPLRAKHGPFGTYGDLRKIELAKVAAMLRAKATEETRKITEAALEEAAHAAPSYIDFVTGATEEKARYFELENRVQGIEDTIRRANAVAQYLTAEARL